MWTGEKGVRGVVGCELPLDARLKDIIDWFVSGDLRDESPEPMLAFEGSIFRAG